MSDIKNRQSTDADQGGEGTNSFHNKGYDALTKSINDSTGVNAEQSRDKNVPDINDGTK
jgi:hypothetical protein